MGDCRIRILIANQILPPGAASESDADEWHVVHHVASADSTIRDVYNATLKPLWNQNILPDNIRVWDCTLHPPRDISSLLTRFGDTTGPNSKTLYDAGWFPSGTWQVLPNNAQPKQGQHYDDVQYNLQDQPTLQSSLPVTLVGHEHDESILPSQVLQSVTQRFPTNVDDKKEYKEALQIRKQKRQEQRAKEAARHARLEERIQSLSNKKNSNVSLQVQRMLLKSRCTGSSSLKMHDRIYLSIVILQQGSSTNDDRQEYRYFSQQDSVARILATVQKTSLPQEAELLIRRQSTATSGETTMYYRKLPLAMRLYEAIAEKYLEPVDHVVIRCFTPPNEEPTMCVTEDVEEEEEQPDTEMQVNIDASVDVDDNSKVEEAISSEATAMETEMNESSLDESICNRMKEAIAAMDEAALKKTKKKASSTSEKVRTMLMKSKAKGDKKRIPKMDDRFFLELVVVKDYGDGTTSCSASATSVFLAKSDTVKRIMRDCVSIPDGCTATIYSIPKDENSGDFCEVPGDLLLSDAEVKGFIQSFDRVVVRIYK